MNELALFAGAGGGILGGALLGWTTVCAVELEEYPRKVLLARQRDGILPKFPIWDDVTTFDGKPWRGLVDVVSGGFPCQDISVAGRGAGINGARSGLWQHMHRIICEVRPRFAFVENSPMLTNRGLHRVLGDLAESGYHAAWLVLGAANVGAPHRRDRMWILGIDSHQSPSPHPNPYSLQCAQFGQQHQGPEKPAGCCENQLVSWADVADPDSNGGTALCLLSRSERETLGEAPEKQPERAGGCARLKRREEMGRWWKVEPNVGRVADGVASRVDRLKAIGNGQVPLVAATAFSILHNKLNQSTKIQ